MPMYVKTWTKSGATYASVYRSDRVGGKVKTTEVAYLGRVEPSQLPYLKAAYAKRKPKLVYEDGSEFQG